jgi:hypothetical protein
MKLFPSRYGMKSSSITRYITKVLVPFGTVYRKQAF